MLSPDLVSVMVSRSGNSGEQLTHLIKKQGLLAWHIPTLKIIAEDILLPLEDFHQAIFVSPNAVKYSVEKNLSLIDILPEQLIAVGQGTAERLCSAGFEKISIPEEFNSEGLLQLPELRKVNGQHILIVKGRGGRTLLAETLKKRGAICYCLDVYGRVTEQLNIDLWKAFLTSAKMNIILMASVDAMRALNSNLDNDFDYSNLVLIVASKRIKEHALQYGFKKIIVADLASNEVMLKAITGFVESENN